MPLWQSMHVFSPANRKRWWAAAARVLCFDRSIEAVKRRPKADLTNALHIPAPMPGKVSTVVVKPGQPVKAGDRLLSIEAMKMETAVYSPMDAAVAEVLVDPGNVVEARDLLVVLKER